MLFQLIVRLTPSIGSPRLFDAVGIQAAHLRAERRFLFRVGGLIRTRMLRLMPRREGASAPGQPPHAHVRGRGGIRFIRFRVDEFRKTVVAGPVKNAAAKNPDGKPAPETLDRGGIIRVDRNQARLRTNRPGTRRASTATRQNSRGDLVRIRPRPIRQTDLFTN